MTVGSTPAGADSGWSRGPERAHRVLSGGLGILLAAAAPILLGYTSRNAAVLGRYSVPYAGLLAIHLACAAACLGIALLPRRAARGCHGAIEGAARALLRRGWALAAVLALEWALLVLLACSLAHVSLGRSLALHLLGAGAVLWASIGTILLARTGARQRARALGKYAVSLGLAAGAALAAEAVLRMRPGLLPPRVLYDLPGGGEFLLTCYEAEEVVTVGYRYKPRLRVADRMLASAANLFLQQPHLVRPLPANEDRVLLEAEFTTDENGYRNAQPLLERYPVAGSGDSFTMLSIEPRPWPAILAEKLGQPVLNVGLQGYGPQAEAQALLRFALPRRPGWVILAYFEGNDLIDAEIYDAKQRSGLGWHAYDLAEAGILERYVAFHLLRHGFRLATGGPVEKRPPPGAEGDYPYPFAAKIAGREVELSFSASYLSRLDLSREQVESLAGFRAAMKAIHELDERVRAAGAKLLVAYLPTKEHCYLPTLPATLLEKKLAGAARLEIQEGRLLGSSAGGERITVEGILARIDGQRHAVTQRLWAEGIEVLDLTPILQEAAARGEQLYLVNDTHWSAAGHEIAASAAAARLRGGR